MAGPGHATVLISCADRKGITAKVTNFVFQNGGNIVHADQHIDEQSNTFFMRIEWDLAGFAIPGAEIGERFRQEIAEEFAMSWELSFSRETPRMAILVSRHLHCLQDILLRYRAGQFRCVIPLIISNHPDARAVAEPFEIPFFEIPVDKQNKAQQEQRQIEILKDHEVGFMFLARYHQILSPAFLKQWPRDIINIHHSFLPAFVGKNPYAQAYEKGVKIIGATSHFVTEELDQGPIIEQDTVRVSHRDSLADLVRKGEDLEKIVSARAIRWHLGKRILRYGNKTVVFD